MTAESGEPGWDDQELTRLARLLREANLRISAADAPRRPQFARRLRAITDLAKRDTARAARRLDALLAELPGTGKPDSGPRV